MPANSATIVIEGNGRRRVNVSQNGKVNMTMTVEWKTPDIAPPGV